MLYKKLETTVKDYVNQPQFKDTLQIQGPVEVQFLAQGEYNLNYVLSTGNQKFVFRVNTGSQMSLDNQVGYEYQALDLLKESRVTPLPLYLDDQHREIPYGCLVMEYLPGEPLDYSRDLLRAAETFAKIHSLSFAKGKTDFLIQVEGPFSVIDQEAESLLKSYIECPRGDIKVKKLLERIFLVSGEKIKEEKHFLSQPWRAVINTEVNSHNFIVNSDQGSCHLIDWEKPIYGEPAQDLSMFLIPTTTLWKRNVILTPEQEDRFLESYLKAYRAFAQSNFSPHHSENLEQTLRERVEIFKFFNLLRAISWCAMAWTEYTQPGRPLVNGDTFEKIQMYLEEDFIKRSFPGVF